LAIVSVGTVAVPEALVLLEPIAIFVWLTVTKKFTVVDLGKPETTGETVAPFTRLTVGADAEVLLGALITGWITETSGLLRRRVTPDPKDFWVGVGVGVALCNIGLGL
jgi:hypothetical protein